MKIDALNRYIDTVGEVIALYRSFFVRHFRQSYLRYIKELQLKLVSVDIREIIDEIILNGRADPSEIRKWIKIAVQKLQPDEETSYIVNIPVSTSDLLGDKGKREEYIYSDVNRLNANYLSQEDDELKKILKSDLMTQEDAQEFVIRLHDCLEWVNQLSEELDSELLKLYESTERGSENGIPVKKQIPEELLPDEAKRIFDKATRAGLIIREGDICQWDNTKQLLAYFAEKMSLSFNLGKSRNGEPTINWKLFESMFNVSNLKNAKNDWMKIYTTFTPTGFEKVNKLFE